MISSSFEGRTALSLAIALVLRVQQIKERMIIDAHTHGLHGKYLDKLSTAGGNWAKKRIDSLLDAAQNKPQLIDVALRVEQLERCRIDLQIVSAPHLLDSNLLPGDTTARLAMARALNDNMAHFQEESI